MFCWPPWRRDWLVLGPFGTPSSAGEIGDGTGLPKSVFQGLELGFLVAGFPGYPGYPGYLWISIIFMVFFATPFPFTSWDGKAFSRHGLALKLYFVAAGPWWWCNPWFHCSTMAIGRVEVRHPLDFAMSFLAHLGQGPQLGDFSLGWWWWLLSSHCFTLWNETAPASPAIRQSTLSMIYPAAALISICWAYWSSCPSWFVFSLSSKQWSRTSLH